MRLSWHGWPVNDRLAAALGPNVSVLNTALLDKPHELVGSGFALPNSTVALLVLLASVELKCDAECSMIPRTIPEADPFPDHDILQVPQNGRCFISCLWLSQASHRDKSEWAEFLRSSTGMPLDMKTGQVSRKRLLFEEQCHQTARKSYKFCMYTIFIPQANRIYINIYIYILLNVPFVRANVYMPFTFSGLVS